MTGTMYLLFVCLRKGGEYSKSSEKYRIEAYLTTDHRFYEFNQILDILSTLSVKDREKEFI